MSELLSLPLLLIDVLLIVKIVPDVRRLVPVPGELARVPRAAGLGPEEVGAPLVVESVDELPPVPLLSSGFFLLLDVVLESRHVFP